MKPPSAIVVERLLDRLDRLGDDVPEQEQQDSGRRGAEERLQPGRHGLHATHRQAEEDGDAGQRAEQQCLGGRHFL